jgi:UDP-glucose 4-epimerase
MNKVLVTGGAGYIGSHTIIQLIENGYYPVVLDNLSNSSQKSLDRVKKITGYDTPLIIGDIRNSILLDEIFSENKFNAVIHLAALKAVGESSKRPNHYYQNNVYGTLVLLEAMERHEVSKFVFSSSATVYGEETLIPYVETMKLGVPSSPYGASKVMVERIMQDISKSYCAFQAVSLRYFNPIGAHSSGLIGEDPLDTPNNLLPFVAQVAVGKRKKLNIFGNDYPTKDGTCRRDYLHVVDLAQGHVDALNWLFENEKFFGVEAFNLGTGIPISVLEIIETFVNETGITIPYEFAPRRVGDLPEFWADASKAQKVLRWNTKHTLRDMLKDTWRWQSKNPNGYN